MKPGEQFTCPACGRTAVAKLEKILDGWDVKGEHLVCSFCGTDAGAPDAPKSSDSASVSAGRKALDALSATTIPPPRRNPRSWIWTPPQNTVSAGTAPTRL